MKSIMNEKGVLSVELGKSWLSREEAVSIKAGDIVKLNSFAGDGHKLKFNGIFFANCEFVIFSEVWGVRIKDYIKQPERRQAPESRETITELIPALVQLGRVEYSLGELNNLGIGSFISLDSLFSPEAEGELLLGGIPAAKGKIVSIYENYGLRVTNTIHDSIPEPIVRTTGNLMTSDFDSNFCRDYDFRRPDKFSRTAIQKIYDIHNSFLTTLKNRFPKLTSWESKSVDQMAFYECFELFERKNVSYMTAFDQKHGNEMESPSMIRLIEPAQPQHPLPKSIYDFVKKMSDNPAESGSHNAFLCGIGNESHDILENNVLPLLTASWRNIADFKFVSQDRGKELSSIQKINENEMIVLVHIGPGGKKDEGLYFIYPYLTLVPVTMLLNI